MGSQKLFLTNFWNGWVDGIGGWWGILFLIPNQPLALITLMVTKDESLMRVVVIDVKFYVLHKRQRDFLVFISY